MAKQLGIIKGIHVGMRDVNGPICWFEVKTLGFSSLQVISIMEMTKLIMDAGVYKLEDLNGRPCVVDVDRGICKFESMDV